MFPKPPGERPDDASSVGDILGWFDKVEALELNPRPLACMDYGRLASRTCVDAYTVGYTL